MSPVNIPVIPMQTITMTQRDVPPRTQWALEQSGVPTLLARLYAARGIRSRQELDDSLSQLLEPSDMLGIAQAASLLARALQQQQHVCIVADYDCDGATACATAVRGLRLLGLQQVEYLVPNRLQDGYGLTPAIAQRVAATKAQVLVTVDNGIASVEGVAAAKALGLTVILTDHHLPGEQTPAADAIVNPNQRGCPFASKALAGVGVMFYVLLALRAHLRAQGHYHQQAAPKLDGLLPLVALGTVADLVKLDANNRRLVSQGLQRIRTGKLPAGMAALFAVAMRKTSTASSADFGFALAPRINAAGRLSDMRLGIECLITDDAVRAQELAQQLDRINRERRELEGDMREQAQRLTEHLWSGTDTASLQSCSAISLFDASFHEGVVGIVASRIKDQWHRPCFVFAPSATNPHELRGSGRSVEGFHLRDALDLLAKREPTVLIRFGGHAMAAGCTIAAEHFARFDQTLQQIARQWIEPGLLQKRLLTDGSLPASECRPDVAQSLEREVWGQGFAAPIFCDTVQIQTQRLVGEGKHLALKVKHQERVIDAIWFNHTEPLAASATLAYQLQSDEWQGVTRVKWIVQAAAAN